MDIPHIRPNCPAAYLRAPSAPQSKRTCMKQLLSISTGCGKRACRSRRHAPTPPTSNCLPEQEELWNLLRYCTDRSAQGNFSSSRNPTTQRFQHGFRASPSSTRCSTKNMQSKSHEMGTLLAQNKAPDTLRCSKSRPISWGIHSPYGRKFHSSRILDPGRRPLQMQRQHRRQDPNSC